MQPVHLPTLGTSRQPANLITCSPASLDLDCWQTNLTRIGRDGSWRLALRPMLKFLRSTFSINCNNLPACRPTSRMVQTRSQRAGSSANAVGAFGRACAGPLPWARSIAWRGGSNLPRVIASAFCMAHDPARPSALHTLAGQARAKHAAAGTTWNGISNFRDLAEELPNMQPGGQGAGGWVVPHIPLPMKTNIWPRVHCPPPPTLPQACCSGVRSRSRLMRRTSSSCTGGWAFASW